MNNRELLIKILIELRSNGINNKKLLNLIEQMPPHYFIDILKKYKTLKNVTLGEIVSIAKIFKFSDEEFEHVNSLFFKNKSDTSNNLSVYYRVLGVKENSSMEDITKKYRLLIKDYQIH